MPLNILDDSSSINLTTTSNSSIHLFNSYSNICSTSNINNNNINYFPNNDNSVNNPSLKQKLQKWISDFHVSHNCINSLLSILRSEGLNLPKDARTLLKTPKACDHSIINIHPGSYIHLGVEFMLTKILALNIEHIEQNTSIQLGLNDDGFPLTSSSKSIF